MEARLINQSGREIVIEVDWSENRQTLIMTIRDPEDLGRALESIRLGQGDVFSFSATFTFNR